MLLIIVYYDLADCIVIMYDVTQEESFNSVEKWLSSVLRLTSKNHEIFLIGNKIDKTKERVIAKKQGTKFATNKKIHYTEVSIINSDITNKLLDNITAYVLEKKLGILMGKNEVNISKEKNCNTCSVM